ncbi:MAG: aspartate--tRNA ligase, partial [Eubacterium sp.]|nr:aspartate--tRNA ligase [Eubacterium sp.]
MMDTLNGLKRTAYCAEFNMDNVGEEITVFGWVQRQRDLGNLIFIDLRDRSGIIQLSFNDKTDREIFAKAQSVRSEYVVAAVGTVAERESKNKEIPTGDIEVMVTDFRILSKADTPPFEVEKIDTVGDETTLKYRYLGLRSEKLTKNILMRHKIAKIARDYFYDNDFIEIETPMMIKSTPEGARDYVVPSRIHSGKFYALPQSPQIYKQLTMIAGFDRYVQLARCFRDEDLRADRQPEFTQIDLEMSFVDCDDLMDMAEGFIKKLMKDTIDVDVPEKLPRMTFDDAMNKYGSDKPDTRFDMLIQDVSDWADGTDFVVFKNAIADGGAVKAIVAKGAAQHYSRKKIDKLTEHAKGIGAKGLAYIRWADETPNCSFAKFLKEGELDALLTSLSAEQGDVVFIVSDKTRKALTIMGALRLIIAKELDIIPEGKWNYLWITEMPFFEL